MTITTHLPIEIPLERMTSRQKPDLVKSVDTGGSDEGEIPQWHLEVLAEREKAIASGEMEFLPLDQFIEEVRKTCP